METTCSHPPPAHKYLFWSYTGQSLRCTYMYGGRWVPSVRARLAAGTAEVHVRTKPCSTSWCWGFANHCPEHSDDGIEGPSASTLPSPDFLPSWRAYNVFANKSYFLPFWSQDLHFSCHLTKTPYPVTGSCTCLLPNPTNSKSASLQQIQSYPELFSCTLPKLILGSKLHSTNTCQT